MRRRAEAWERFAASNIPTEAEEVWRYSGIDAFDLDAYAPVTAPGPAGLEPALAVARRLADSLGPRAGLVVTYNGTIEAIEMDALDTRGTVGHLGPLRRSAPHRPRRPGLAGSRTRRLR